ncbi:3045_t:CDS:1, partial [Racocetra persica]
KKVRDVIASALRKFSSIMKVLANAKITYRYVDTQSVPLGYLKRPVDITG